MENFREMKGLIRRVASTVPLDPQYPRIPVEVASIINPYKNYPYFARGQVHAHSKWSDGELDASKVMWEYHVKGYGFVCLTDHDKQSHQWGPFHWQTSRSCDDIFKEPGTKGTIWIPGLEPYGKHHLLWLGITKKHPCRPDEESSLAETILWIEQQGGIAVAAHPWGDGAHSWGDAELMNMGLRGIEFKPDTVSQWDRLLQADYARWGFCTDDSHGRADISQGWVNVNLSQEVFDGRQVIEEMRNGNFYSVYCAGRDPQTYPLFRGIRDRFGAIFVSYDRASEVRFVGRDGRLQHKITSTGEACYQCDGSEGYIRIELQDSQGTTTYSQPLFVYGASVESCVQVNPAQLEVRCIDSGVWRWWYLAHGNDCIWFFFTDEQGAREALIDLQHYHPDRIGFVGRHTGRLNPLLTYFTVDGHAPVGLPPNRSCVPIDSSKLYVELGVDNRWKIINPLPQGGKEWLLDFEDSQIQAQRALEFIRRYHFNAICFVGNLPGNRFKYFINV